MCLASALGRTPEIAAAFIALLTAVIAVASLYIRSATERKDIRLKYALAAYRAVLGWQSLADRASRSSDTNELHARLFELEQEIAYHEAFIYGESQPLSEVYHAFTTAARAKYEPQLLHAIDQQPLPTQIFAEHYCKTRRDYLVAVKASASFYRPLRGIPVLRKLPFQRRNPKIEPRLPPPDWL
jgi:hypothetical protein